MKLLTLLVIILVSGCAENYLRVTEYAGTSLPLPGTNVAAGGCMVSFEGSPPPGVLTYTGDSCTYTTAPQN